MEVALSEFVAGRQEAAAVQLGVSQGAISLMINSDRDIRVELDAQGEVVSAYELKLIGTFKNQ
jgi:DNA-binding transcriptional regulator YdaS (Cro superfamily)